MERSDGCGVKTAGAAIVAFGKTTARATRGADRYANALPGDGSIARGRARQPAGDRAAVLRVGASRRCFDNIALPLDRLPPGRRRIPGAHVRCWKARSVPHDLLGRRSRRVHPLRRVHRRLPEECDQLSMEATKQLRSARWSWHQSHAAGLLIRPNTSYAGRGTGSPSPARMSPLRSCKASGERMSLKCKANAISSGSIVAM